jgi:methionine-rich copper-binding protein CopC
MRAINDIALVTTLLLLPVAAAIAHAHLKSAVPPVGGVVEIAPSEIDINFTEALEPRFSSIEVSDSAGARVDNQDPHSAPDDANRFIVSLKPLQPGTYTVKWHATATDTHKTSGTYKFTVRP